jgi:hypothetical protein
VTAKLNGAVTGSGFITINADSKMEADADTTFFGIGALSFSGSSTDAEVSGDTIAGGDSGTASTNGLFQVTSDSVNKATATSDGATVGLGTVDVKLPQALVSGSTKAVYLGQVTNGTGATATANSANTATATADMVTIGAIAIAFGVAYAEVTSGASTEAGIGGAQVGSGAVTISATSFDTAHASCGRWKRRRDHDHDPPARRALERLDARVRRQRLRRHDERGLADRHRHGDAGCPRDREHRQHLRDRRQRRVAEGELSAGRPRSTSASTRRSTSARALPR